MITLKQKLQTLTNEDLVEFIVSLYGLNKTLDEQIDFLAEKNDPQARAKQLKKRVQSLKRSSKFVSYYESATLAGEITGLLNDICALIDTQEESKLAFELIDLFMDSHANVLNRADDSNGSIGDVYRDAVRVWLSAAKPLRDAAVSGGTSKSPKTRNWQEEVYQRFQQNDYGMWDFLLPQSNTLLTEDELRQLAWRFENAAREAIAADPKAKTVNMAALRACIGIEGVAQALGDLSLYEKATLLRSPSPNELQKLKLASYCLDIQHADRALFWLQKPWDARFKTDRLRLLDACYLAQNDTVALKELRMTVYGDNPNFDNLQALLAVCDEQESILTVQQAVARARTIASFPDKIDTLLKLEALDSAEAEIFSHADRLQQESYYHVSEWASLFFDLGRWLCAVICYRALIDDILQAGRSQAYKHAAKYFKKLASLNTKIDDYRKIRSHDDYVTNLRLQYKLKRAFWEKVDS